MEDSTLLKLSLVCSLLGILLLIFISDKLVVKEITISEISRSKIDQDVRIKAEVISASLKEDVLFLKVKDSTSEIDVVIFNPENLDINKGDKLEITGKVSIYKNKLELIAKSISPQTENIQ